MATTNFALESLLYFASTKMVAQTLAFDLTSLQQKALCQDLCYAFLFLQPCQTSPSIEDHLGLVAVLLLFQTATLMDERIGSYLTSQFES